MLRSPDPTDVGVSLTHRELLARDHARGEHVPRARPAARAAASRPSWRRRCPSFRRCCSARRWPASASSLNYLLSRDAIFDLLNAQQATILVIPARDARRDLLVEGGGRARAGSDADAGLVIGGDGEGAPAIAALDEALRRRAGAMRSTSSRSTDRDTVCALFHTGGTTGRPKLVQLTHGNQIHAAFGFAQVFGYDERDIVINGFPFFHVGGTMTVGLSVLAAGGHIVVPSPYGLRPPAVIDALLGHRRALRRDGRRRRADLDRGADQQLESRGPTSRPSGWRSPAAPCCRRRSAAASRRRPASGCSRPTA